MLTRVRHPAKYTAHGLFRCSAERKDGRQCENPGSRRPFNSTTCAAHLKGIERAPRPAPVIKRPGPVATYKRDIVLTWRSARDDDAPRARLKDFLERQKCARSAKRARALDDRRNTRVAEWRQARSVAS